ncbi:hypothetical protein Hdeb2414_s0002g00068791 [Helianthus debilis subsp. tardiflorus]
MMFFLTSIVLAGGSHGSFHGNLIVIRSFNDLSSTIEQPEQQYHSHFTASYTC